jgi:hydrogenase maturation factor
MQRKEIDEVGFAILETELTDKQVLPGDISIIMGDHGLHGRVILVQAAGLYLALADDVSAIVGLDEPIEPA